MLREDCPLPISGRFACRSRPDTLPVSACSWSPTWAHGLGETPRLCQGLWSPGPPLREYDKETSGPPTFPSYPCRCMPHSETPVVSCPLAFSPAGLLPSGQWTPSAFPSLREGYPLVHDDTLFGAQSRGLPP